MCATRVEGRDVEKGVSISAGTNLHTFIDRLVSVFGETIRLDHWKRTLGCSE